MSQRAGYNELGAGIGPDISTQQDHTIPPPGYDRANQADQESRTVWSYYNVRSQQLHADLISEVNSTAEVLLVFAGLLSAVVSAFISQTYPMLQPDTADTLVSILQELRKPGSVPDKPFVVPIYAVRVNCFLFAGLFISMNVALLSILVKQWTRAYLRRLSGVSSPHLRARIYHFYYYGAKRWFFSESVELLTVLMYCALFISIIGIIDLLLATAPPVGYVSLSLFIPGLLYFLMTNLIPLFSLDAPFRSPISDYLLRVSQSVQLLSKNRRWKDEDIEMTTKELGDQVESTQGADIERKNIVRTQVHLDLEILTHLLGTADKSTERWLLELCLEKLPELVILEHYHPESILRREIILEVYNFLAKKCIDNQGSRKEIKPDRLKRARQLCDFIAWFLSLPRSTATRTRLRQQLSKWYDPMELPNALATDTSSASLSLALTAQARLEHLFDQEYDDETCRVCDKVTQNLLGLQNDVTKSREQGSQVVTSFIIYHSDCLLFHAKMATDPLGTGRTSMCSQSLQYLTDTLSLIPPPTEKNKAEWINLVKKRREMSNPDLQASWFNKLATIIGSAEATSSSYRRTHSPAQMAASTSTAGTSSQGFLQGKSPHPFGQPSAHSNLDALVFG
ncbi:hypothetical protein FRC18_000811 [Serendipita sp. 400]|nr:hypothetical protein FRC18_000811 [Serendipita sp. 400]